MDAAARAVGNLERATLNVRSRAVPPVPDEAEYVRYQTLKMEPTKLFDFVRRGMGTTDPDRIQRGAAEYLTEMRKRFGE